MYGQIRKTVAPLLIPAIGNHNPPFPLMDAIYFLAVPVPEPLEVMTSGWQALATTDIGKNR